LKQRYTKAKFVNYYDGELRQGNDARTRQLAVFSKKQLAFLQKSPNYCREDPILKIKGTKGRKPATKVELYFNKMNNKNSTLSEEF
jgi:hypothetical protein